MINGIISIYKKRGYTSHDVVAKARGILKERRIGHTGTLDPEAEGVLPLCIGKATKAVPYLADMDKCYEAEVILGVTTTTEDATGEVIETKEVDVTKKQIEEVVYSFLGSYTQTPPMYSAIKVNGVRLYELARRGEIVERPSRKVSIHHIEIIEWMDTNRFRIRVRCSKGTYIRTLCTDIGHKLGCGAHMGYLLRTEVGPFELKNSLTLEELEAHRESLDPYILSLEMIFKQYPRVEVTEKGQRFLNNGNALSKNYIKEAVALKDGIIVRVYNIEGIFTALYRWEEKIGQFKVYKMFL